jgi:two-component system chemotaxis sensor kinase CheA
MDLADLELINEFVVESQEGLANVETQMLAIEAGGADIDVELVNAVFRTMHSIKGSAGFLGLDRIGALAHSLEELLDDLRNRVIVPDPGLVTGVLRSADLMKTLIDAVETSNDVDVSSHVAELQELRSGRGAPSASESAPCSPGGGERASDAAPPQSAIQEFLAECHANLDRMEQLLLETNQGLQAAPDARTLSRTLHTIKAGAALLRLPRIERVAHAAERKLVRDLGAARSLPPATATALLAAVDKCREGLQLVGKSGDDDGLEADALLSLLQGEPREPAGGSSIASEPPVDPPRSTTRTHDAEPAKSSWSATADANNGERTAAVSGDSTIRVDVALLDKLMTRVGELVLARNQILQYTSGFDDPVFHSTAQRLNLITTELQEGVMKTRMQPIGNVWAKFPRVVRDLSAQLGKQVGLEIEGKETELDKTIVEAIKDPLTHLIRNAVDHGIETPEARIAAGKKSEGRLSLRAYHEGGQVNIEIADDGAGLNVERIRRKAVERGLISADVAARMSDREAAQIILLPGFSTAETVTSVSGRGVGMDVVKTNIERIGGTIDVQSKSGEGTTIRIKIPLTLAIIPALVVTCRGDRYAIPQVSVLELVRLEREQARSGIEFVHGAPVFRLRGKLLPLAYLADRLGVAGQAEVADDAVINIVVLRANDRQFGLVVDGINDTEEIVVKPLSPQLKGLKEFAGATIMGDGAVALIIDVMGVAMASGLVDALHDQNVTGLPSSESRASSATETLLVVDVGDARRFALPVSMISRLETAPRTAIEQADGREVIQYRGVILPLVRLTDVFGGPQGADGADEVKIVVYADGDSCCGLVVNRIVDIVETQVQFDGGDATSRLLGTVVIHKQVTDVLNLRSLARPARRRRRRAAPRLQRSRA